jgi:hypothetical protein
VPGIDHQVSCSWSSAEQNITFLQILHRSWLGSNTGPSVHQTNTLAIKPLVWPRNCSYCNSTYVAHLIISYPIIRELTS